VHRGNAETSRLAHLALPCLRCPHSASGLCPGGAGAVADAGAIAAGLRYLDMKRCRAIRLRADMGPVAAEPNRLNDQSLVRYYEQEWRAIVH